MISKCPVNFLIFIKGWSLQQNAYNTHLYNQTTSDSKSITIKGPMNFFFPTGALTTLFSTEKGDEEFARSGRWKAMEDYQYTEIQWKITGAKQAWEENLYTRYRRYVNSAAWVTWLNQQCLLFSLGHGHRLPIEISLCYRQPKAHTHTIKTDELGQTQKRLEGRCGKEDELGHPANHEKNKQTPKQLSQLLKCGKILTNSRFHVFYTKKILD